MHTSWWLGKNQKFTGTGYGIWRNKGCPDNLAILTTVKIKAFEEQNTVLALFLDFQFNICKRLANLMYSEECEFEQESHGYNSPHVHVLVYIITTCFDIKMSSSGIDQFNLECIQDGRF
jgi:hypothetical protein